MDLSMNFCLWTSMVSTLKPVDAVVLTRGDLSMALDAVVLTRGDLSMAVDAVVPTMPWSSTSMVCGVLPWAPNPANPLLLKRVQF